MGIETKLGKIKKVTFGMGGYQEAMIGIGFDLGGESWGIGDFWGHWADRSDHAQWSEQDQIVALGKIALRIRDLLRDAKRDDVSKLAGTPIEITMDSGRMKSWRVLTEVV